MGSIVLTIDSPTMTVNGTSKAIDAEGSKPALDAGGYTMLPLRGVVEAMGGSLTWDAANRIVTMVKDGQTIKVPIGSTKLTVDGVQKDMLANNGTYKAAHQGTDRLDQADRGRCPEGHAGKQRHLQGCIHQ